VFCNLSARRHFAGRTNQIREQQKFLRREILPNVLRKRRNEVPENR
jgi:hypothetical protein